MSVAIAIKQNDKVYVGVDSLTSCGFSKITLSNPNNYKMWKTRGLDNSLMAHTGNARDMGVVKFQNYIPEVRSLTQDIDFEFVQTELMYDIFDSCKERGFVNDNDEGPSLTSSYLFTYQDKIYLLNTDLTVIEFNDYAAIGSGKDSALGSLASSKNDPVEIRIIKAIIAASNIDLHVGFPIIISNTESTEFLVIHEEYAKKALNAYKTNKENIIKQK